MTAIKRQQIGIGLMIPGIIFALYEILKNTYQLIEIALPDTDIILETIKTMNIEMKLMATVTVMAAIGMILFLTALEEKKQGGT